MTPPRTSPGKLHPGSLPVPEQGLGCTGMSDFYGRADDEAESPYPAPNGVPTWKATSQPPESTSARDDLAEISAIAAPVAGNRY